MWNHLKWRDGEGWVTSDPKVETCDVVAWRCAVVTPVDLSVLATELLACQSHPQTICGSHRVTTPVSVEQTLQQKKWQNNKKNKKPTYTHTNTTRLFGRLCEYMRTHLSPSEHLCSICPPPHWNWAAKRWKQLRSEWVTFCTTCPSLNLTLRCEHMRILHYLTNKSETLD